MTENRNALEEMKFICDHAVNLNCKFVLTDGSERRRVNNLTNEKTKPTDVLHFFFLTPET